MICRVCYISGLTPDERDRANSEPITGTVFLCIEHQTLVEQFERMVDWSAFLHTNRERIHAEAERDIQFLEEVASGRPEANGCTELTCPHHGEANRRHAGGAS